MKFIKDVSLIFKHELIGSIKNPVWVFVSLFQPIGYVFFYGPVVVGMGTKAGISTQESLASFIPGMLVMLSLFGTIFVGFSIIDEIRNGLMERLLVSPLHKYSILIGKALRDVLVLQTQSIVILSLSKIAFGLEVKLIEASCMLLLIGALGGIFAMFSYALAIVLKSEDSFAPAINMISQPLMLLSGILLPLTFAPAWLNNLSSVNPLRYIVDASRLIFVGDYTDPTIYKAIIMIACLIIVSIWCGMRSINNILK